MPVAGGARQIQALQMQQEGLEQRDDFLIGNQVALFDVPATRPSSLISFSLFSVIPAFAGVKCEFNHFIILARAKAWHFGDIELPLIVPPILAGCKSTLKTLGQQKTRVLTGRNAGLRAS